MRAFSFSHITRHDYTLLIGLLLAAYVYIFFIVDSSLFHHLGLDTLHQKCLRKCESDACKTASVTWRDKNYYLDANNGDRETPHKNCAFTVWELSHLLMHLWIGYRYNLPLSVGISVAFELFEHYFYDCGSMFDVGYNLAGGVSGAVLRSAL